MWPGGLFTLRKVDHGCLFSKRPSPATAGADQRGGRPESYPEVRGGGPGRAPHGGGGGGADSRRTGGAADPRTGARGPRPQRPAVTPALSASAEASAVRRSNALRLQGPRYREAGGALSGGAGGMKNRREPSIRTSTPAQSGYFWIRALAWPSTSAPWAQWVVSRGSSDRDACTLNV